MSGSPQSTLCEVGTGCGCRQGSSHGSPNGPSQVSSPPATWDLLYAAAGEVARMRMNEEAYGLTHGRGLLGPLRKPSPATVPVKGNTNADIGYFPHQSLSHQQLQMQVAQVRSLNTAFLALPRAFSLILCRLLMWFLLFQQLRQLRQQHMKQQGSVAWGAVAQGKAAGRFQPRQAHIVQNRGRNSECAGVRNARPLGLSASAWPPLRHPQNQQQNQQQNSGSGMRAVFLGTPGGKRESTGTGVFLPRHVDGPSDARRKPGRFSRLVSYDEVCGRVDIAVFCREL